MGRGVWTPRSRVFSCRSGESSGASRLRASRALCPPTGWEGLPPACPLQPPGTIPTAQTPASSPPRFQISLPAREREEAGREEEAEEGGDRRAQRRGGLALWQAT